MRGCLSVIFAGVLLASMAQAKESVKKKIPKNKIGAQFEAAYYKITGNGTEDSKANAFFAITQAEVFYKFRGKNSEAYIETDLNLLQAGATANFLNDAWVSHSIHDAVSLRFGLFDAYSNTYLDYAHSSTSELGREIGLVKLEAYGSTDKLSWGLQTWEDEAADQTMEDKDSGLLTNMAAKAVFQADSAIEAGLIYRKNGGYNVKNASGNEVKKEDATGYQIFVKYSKKSEFDFWIRMTQKIIDKDQQGGAYQALGANFYANKPLSFHFFHEIRQQTVSKDADSPKSGAVSDIMIKYMMDANINYYFGVSSWAKDSETDSGTVIAGSVSGMAIGIQAKY